MNAHCVAKFIMLMLTQLKPVERIHTNLDTDLYRFYLEAKE
jgi:hypothetical protein